MSAPCCRLANYHLHNWHVTLHDKNARNIRNVLEIENLYFMSTFQEDYSYGIIQLPVWKDKKS
jgi:hypothetical protein